MKFLLRRFIIELEPKKLGFFEGPTFGRTQWSIETASLFKIYAKRETLKPFYSHANDYKMIVRISDNVVTKDT